MGKPSISFWEVFLRETLQNSWDARTPEIDQITFSIEGRRLGPEEMSALQRRVLTTLPREPDTERSFLNGLDPKGIEVITVTDRGTKGLGGDTRADVAVGADGCTDFVDFVRNVGRSEDKGYGGGTYGFGKGILYTASSLATCLVYTQTWFNGRLEPRFIAVCVADTSYNHAGRRYTGRHWWGVVPEHRPDYVEPLTGKEARELALELGICDLDETETGTSLTILRPNVEQSEAENLESVVSDIHAAAHRWAWPHMIDLGRGPSIAFKFSVHGRDLPVSDPSAVPKLVEYVRSYKQTIEQRDAETAQDRFPIRVRAIETSRIGGHKRLGVLAFEARNRGSEETDLTNHVALIRDPRFVVKYVQVAETPGMVVRGVFLADTKFDADFAKSEPVAHDDWVPSEMGLAKGQRNPVRIALDRVKGEFKTYATETAAEAISDQPSGISAVSRRLAHVMNKPSGQGAERIRRSTPARTARRSQTLRVFLDDEPELGYQDGRVHISFGFSISMPPGADPGEWILHAGLVVGVDGGRAEKEPPAGALSPELVGWFKGSELLSSEPQLPVHALQSGRHHVVVVPPPETAVGLKITAERK